MIKTGTSCFKVSDKMNYNEHLSYDQNGNITTLTRNGDLDSETSVIAIDNLIYNYDAMYRLQKVVDYTGNPSGFKEGADNEDEYGYDKYGNMIRDDNKDITSITYNHLNLPKKIEFGSTDGITYLYNANGQKLKKTVVNSPNVSTVNYQGVFHYENGLLRFLVTNEGYVNFTTEGYNYIYNYTDHLGNIRVSYFLDLRTRSVAIFEENHYYPFGLKHNGYNNISPPNNVYQYKYNGKEFQDELGLNVYDFHFRQYMQDLGRTTTLDPFAEEFYDLSSYSFLNNTPVNAIDPDGRFTLTGQAAQNFVRDLQSQLDSKDDDITVNSKGIVTNVVKNDQPNRFFDESGNQLHFNDPDNDFSLYNSWQKGDRLFHPISDKELGNAILNAGTRRTNKWIYYSAGLSYFLTAWDSHGKADFTMSYLVPKYFSQSEKSYLEEGVFRTSYISYQHFFKFGDTNTIYNLYDAGNYMWGSWMRLNGYQSWEVKMGSQANELRKFGLDSDADQRAIINGYNHFNFLFNGK